MPANSELIARVVRQERGAWIVKVHGTPRLVEHFRGPVVPVVGDLVELQTTGDSILRVLPRSNFIARRAPGTRPGTQILAANASLALIVMGLDADYNPRRLERYLTMTAQSGVRPAILLNKRDLCSQATARVAETRAIAQEAPVLPVCALEDNLNLLLGCVVEPGCIAVLLGSSGAGKSTLVNGLLGRDVQATNAVRSSDARGRHTTTARSLIEVPGGWSVIDLPGLREVGLLPGSQAVEAVFAGMTASAAACRFRDCTHTVEPGCAVRGAATPPQLASYTKLRHESQEEERRQARIRQKAKRAFQRTERFNRW